MTLRKDKLPRGGFGRGPGKMSSQSGLATANAYMDGIIADHQKALTLLDGVRG